MALTKRTNANSIDSAKPGQVARPGSYVNNEATYSAELCLVLGSPHSYQVYRNNLLRGPPDWDTAVVCPSDCNTRNRN